MKNWYETWKKRYKAIKENRSVTTSDYAATSHIRHRNKLKWFSSPVLMRNLALAAAVMVVLGTMGFVGVFAFFAKDLPQPDKVVRRDGYSTKIMDRNGVLLYEVFADKQRTPVAADAIPDTLKKAVVAIEDKNFYQHGGFDKQGYIRIIWNVISKRRLIGGSTLTQQLVKNVLLTSDRTLARKLKELVLAIQIENKYNKDQIMQMYLNEAPYGGTVWGIGTASEELFQKPVSQLNLLESAIIAGLPQSPSRYSPLAGKDKDGYKVRTKDVLRRMREENFITKDQENQALNDLDALVITPSLVSIKAPHFTMYVKQQLEDLYGATMVAQGGLRVYTSLDYDLQQKAQAAVTEEVAKVANQGVGNGAAVIMDPKTGEVLAMVGSKDYFAKDYDGQVNVTLSERQPGSTIKPVTYALAFAKGFSPASMVMDVPTQFPGATQDKPYAPQNYDGKFRGPVSLRNALASSLNIPAVKLLAIVGLQNMMQQAYDMGFPTLEPTKENLSKFGLALTLGGGEVRLIDLTSSYSSFANGGIKVVLKNHNQQKF